METEISAPEAQRTAQIALGLDGFPVLGQLRAACVSLPPPPVRPAPPAPPAPCPATPRPMLPPEPPAGLLLSASAADGEANPVLLQPASASPVENASVARICLVIVTSKRSKAVLKDGSKMGYIVRQSEMARAGAHTAAAKRERRFALPRWQARRLSWRQSSKSAARRSRRAWRNTCSRARFVRLDQTGRARLARSESLCVRKVVAAVEALARVATSRTRRVGCRACGSRSFPLPPGRP
jgi:hypothetical protein